MSTRGKGRPSAYAWLWAEIERRFGAEVKQELYEGFLEVNRAYQRAIWQGKPAPPPPRTKREKRGK